MAERGHGAGATPSYSAALRRFWWLMPAGIVVAIAAATSTVYTLPDFTPRDPVLYTANARLLVTSPEGSYIRVSVPRVAETAAEERSGSQSPGQSGGGGGPVIIRDAPDVQPLLAAANLYPLLIESDPVQQLRVEMFGPMPGTVTARAVAAVETPTRFIPSELPVIDIFATSPTPQDAIALAGAMSQAFGRWITLEQERARLKPNERILIEQLVTPRQTVATGGASFGIPVLVALAVLAAFAALALVLDRIFAPRIAIRTTET